MNKIVAENSLPGALPAEWDIPPAMWGDSTIEGFASQMSVNLGETVEFKVQTKSAAYRIDIYRLGWYGGLGARKVATVRPSVPLPQSQPSPSVDFSTGLIECSGWEVSATWDVPIDHTSGIHLAKLVCEDRVGLHHIVFVVRDDVAASQVLVQTSDTTWQAYNTWGGASLYENSLVPVLPRAHKVSYDRPFATRSNESGANYLFNAEYPLVRWLEANGFDVSYCTGVDTDLHGERLLDHPVFVSVGHDEYWSGDQRRHVEEARDAGVHLVFLSGNEIYWRTRWEQGINTLSPHRTLVCYKETIENARTDPSGEWTGTWRDPRFSTRGNGEQPENALSGTWSRKVAGFSPSAIQVPADFSSHRFWRDTSIATLAPGGIRTLTVGTLGYEYDEAPLGVARPAGLAHLSSTVEDVLCLQDYGSIFTIATATHSLTLYRHTSGALVFSAGTVQWAWGLDAVHDVGGRVSGAADPDIRQATLNLLVDMGVQAETLQLGLVAATASTDGTPPTSTISIPLPGSVLKPGQTVEISGTASDIDGRVAGVEISVNDGVTWRPA
ncbi:MAG: N,N-dimethylformamidase beta subunit family domain-containing protein, partial [Gemmatimonadaceae bacterium]